MAQELNFNLKPTNFNPVVDQSSDTTYILVVQDADGNPCNLNGFTARMQLRPFPGSTTVYDTLTTENGRLTVSGSDVTITFPASVTATYTFLRAVYDVLIFTNGVQWRIAQGSIEFKKGVTV